MPTQQITLNLTPEELNQLHIALSAHGLNLIQSGLNLIQSGLNDLPDEGMAETNSLIKKLIDAQTNADGWTDRTEIAEAQRVNEYEMWGGPRPFDGRGRG